MLNIEKVAIFRYSICSHCWCGL